MRHPHLGEPLPAEPVPDGGAFFERQWLKPAGDHPPRETLNVYGASDYAVTRDGGDYTVHIVVGVDPRGDMHVLDLWRKQADSGEWIAAWCDLVKKWRPISWAEETGQIRSALGPVIEAEARRTGAYVHRQQFPTRGDKAVRAQSIRARMSMRGLYVPSNAPWLQDFEAELLRFPAGVHDDCVDSWASLGSYSTGFAQALRPRQRRSPRRVPEADTARFAAPVRRGEYSNAARLHLPLQA